MKMMVLLVSIAALYYKVFFYTIPKKSNMLRDQKFKYLIHKNRVIDLFLSNDIKPLHIWCVQNDMC